MGSLATDAPYRAPGIVRAQVAQLNAAFGGHGFDRLKAVGLCRQVRPELGQSATYAARQHKTKPHGGGVLLCCHRDTSLLVLEIFLFGCAIFYSFLSISILCFSVRPTWDHFYVLYSPEVFQSYLVYNPLHSGELA